MSYGRGKRYPNVPTEAIDFAYEPTKADLLEAAWSLAGLCNAAGSVDDHASTRERLLAEINLHRKARGARPINLVGAGKVLDPEA